MIAGYLFCQGVIHTYYSLVLLPIMAQFKSCPQTFNNYKYIVTCNIQPPAKIESNVMCFYTYSLSMLLADAVLLVEAAAEAPALFLLF